MLAAADSAEIAYQHIEGKSPGILFLSGFNSNMQGEKALALEAWCKNGGRQFSRFDYYGHGQSSGCFEEGTIGRWIDDAIAVVDNVCTGPQLLVGSSMGGWIMLHVAMARPERVLGLVGIAAAPDFTEALSGQHLSGAQLAQLDQSGFCDIENCYDDGEAYRISRHLLEEAKNHLLLSAHSIAVELPVRLLHGQCDEDVPWQTSLLLAEKLSSADVEVQLVKDGDHRLSRPHDLRRLQHTLVALLAALENPDE